MYLCLTWGQGSCNGKLPSRLWRTHDTLQCHSMTVRTHPLPNTQKKPDTWTLNSFDRPAPWRLGGKTFVRSMFESCARSSAWLPRNRFCSLQRLARTSAGGVREWVTKRCEPRRRKLTPTHSSTNCQRCVVGLFLSLERVVCRPPHVIHWAKAKIMPNSILAQPNRIGLLSLIFRNRVESLSQVTLVTTLCNACDANVD